jgi:hypothetical protein
VDTVKSLRVARQLGRYAHRRVSGNVDRGPTRRATSRSITSAATSMLSDSTGDRSIRDVKGTVHVPED